MKIRITQAGWAGFSDYLGSVLFIDGVSADHVSTAEQQALAGIVEIETVPEDGSAPKNPSIAQVIIDTLMSPAVFSEAGASAPVDPVLVARAYSESELSSIADNTGIKGLRAISDPMGLKGTSIVDLIGKIIAWQASKLPAAEVQPAVAVLPTQEERDAEALAAHDAQVAADAAAAAAQEAANAVALQANVDALANQAAHEARVAEEAAFALQEQTDAAIAAAAAAAGNAAE